MPQDQRTDDFDFDLPESLIAQQATEPRDHARLLHVRAEGLVDYHVYDLPRLLRPDDVLVLNNTKVIPARLYGQRGVVRVEVLLHKQLSPTNLWRAFARPGKRLKVGDIVAIADDFRATVTAKHEGGEVDLDFATPDVVMKPNLLRYGEPPLPPYIHRADQAAKADTSRYQTVYAKEDGAVAAPTAGLHFTPELLAKLASMGIAIQHITLHVGAGTFLPVKADKISDHVMHSEWFSIAPEVAAALNTAKAAGRRIVAVGTTALRALESAADETGRIVPQERDTAIFITPGYRFRAVDALMTNFHLPRSTLFMLVSAFAGPAHMRAAYDHAMKNGYRFYSYGDSSLLERQTG